MATVFFFVYLSTSVFQMGRTLSKVQQALSWSYGEEVKPFKPPLSDAEFHSYLNSQGQLTRPEELRLRIYHGGVEPSLRKVELRLFPKFMYSVAFLSSCILFPIIGSVALPFKRVPRWPDRAGTDGLHEEKNERI